MKKTFFILCCLVSLSGFSQTVDEVIKKYTDYMGGLDAFNKISSAKLSGIVTSQGSEFPLTTQLINGKAMRTDVEIMGQTVTNCYFNGKGWKINPLAGVTSPTEISGGELYDFKIQCSMASQLMDYKARGHQVEKLGDETTDGIKAFKIKLTSKEDSKVTSFYISTVDYTLIKSVTSRQIQGQDMDVETYYSDLKDIGGVKFFMSRDSKIEGEVFQSIKFEKIELNVTIDEKIFEMPK